MPVEITTVFSAGIEGLTKVAHDKVGPPCALIASAVAGTSKVVSVVDGGGGGGGLRDVVGEDTPIGQR